MIVAFAIALAACNGEMVSAIDIRVHPASTAGITADAWDRASDVAGVHFATTRVSVVHAYLFVRAGRPCTERDRAESERLLRAQRFIAAAAVRALPDGAGGVRIQVDVVDEFPIILGAGVSRGSFSSAVLGSQNLSGLGLSTAASVTRGFAYRTGYEFRATQFGAFGRPDFIAFDVERQQHGDRLNFEVAEPFLTDLQRNAFHLSGGGSSTFATLMQPAGSEVALFTRRTYWDAGWVRRLGAAIPGRTVGVLGTVVMGENVRVGNDVVIVSDTGLVPAPDAALATRFHTFHVARIAAVGGVRRLNFVTVQGFDALRAAQDVGFGVQLAALAGPSFSTSKGDGDLFIASDLYAAGGDAESFYAVRLLGEARGNHEARRWDGVVASARFSWSGRTSDAWTTLVSVEGAMLESLSFPAQLSFRDADGGVRGYADANAAGGQRAVARLERRWRLPRGAMPVDLATAFFADAGKLWAGDAPYGVTSPVRGALGVSVLGAYPSGGKRTYRLDFAFPLNPENQGSKFEIRFNSSDRTVGVWAEPRDVARNRTGAMPATLLKW